MTEATMPSPAESVTDSPKVVGFGAAEIAYLICQGTGALKDKNAEMLQVRADALTEQIAALGASSLLARGEIVADGDAMNVRGGARVLNQALNAALRWTEVAMVNGTGVEAALYIQARDVSVFLQPAALSTWFMVIKDPQGGDAQLLKQVMEDNLARHPEAAMYFGSQTLRGSMDHLFIRASDGGLWDVAHVESPGQQDRTDGLSTEAMLAELTVLLALPEGQGL